MRDERVVGLPSHLPVVALLLLAGPLAASGGSGFDLQGHRGARGLAPENTLAAFARALALGVTTLELDLGVTADGVVVVTHDPELNPDLTRDARGAWLERPGPPIVQLTYERLRGYDVGRLRSETPYAARYPEQTPADGQRIPRLADVFALAARAGNAAVRFNVETKSDPRKTAPTLAPEPFADAVVRVVRAHHMEARTTIQSFDWRTLRHVAKVAPEIARVCLSVQRPGDDNVEAGRAGAPTTLAGLDVDDFGGSVPRLVQAAGCAVWSPNALDLTPAAVAEAHRLGLSVIPWTVNDPKQMDELIGHGVDGIITDRPDRLRQVVQSRGLPLPASTPVEP
jgi:glycerophosphoryl diester phosphodiesterase